MSRNHDELWVRCDTLLTPFRRHEGCLLHIAGGKIAEIKLSSDTCRLPTAKLIHEGGATVVPGFVDVHVHGAGGQDVMEGSLRSLETISETLARYGITSFLATTVSASPTDTAAALRSLAETQNSVESGANVVGIHMEGPFLNPARRGAHAENYLRPAELSEFWSFVEMSRSTIRKITLAPEMDPGLEVSREATRMGICVSMGHSDATFEQARRAAEAGVRNATHLFNAMRPFHQREPGIAGLVLTDENIYAEVIADGHHVHSAALQLVVRLKPIERVVLVSDGTTAVGMPDGNYKLGDKPITVRRRICRDADGNLAGSTLTLDSAVRYLVNEMELSLEEAVSAATASPARSIGIGGCKGMIAPGADADLVFLDGSLNVVKTMVAGRIVYEKERTGTDRITGSTG